MRPPVFDVADALARAHALTRRPGPVMLGITGPPGAGKSTLAEAVAAEVPGTVLVGMDGFHLAHRILEERGMVDRKGAPDTFDAEGYVALLRRVRALADGRQEGKAVWAPEFRREDEDAVAGSVAVTAATPLVVTEGNYLLLDEPPWTEVAGLLDECWYVELDAGERRKRLRKRHEHFGATPDAAHRRTWGNDERNAVSVAATRSRADAVVQAGSARSRSHLD